MRIPDASHPISIAPAAQRVRIMHGDRVIADTRSARTLQEASYPAVYYIPREDADMSLLTRTDASSYCPYKGDAAYYSIDAGDRTSANAVWAYESPYPAVVEIAGHLAFYPARVDSIELLPLSD